MIVHISFVAVVALVAWAFHRYQLVSDHLLPYLRQQFPQYLGQYRPLSTFADQSASGLSSSTFDLEANNAGDSREGLDSAGAAEVHEIMRRESVSFDEARLRRHHRILQRNGADPTGMPTDRKAITRL